MADNNENIPNEQSLFRWLTADAQGMQTHGTSQDNSRTTGLTPKNPWDQIAGLSSQEYEDEADPMEILNGPAQETIYNEDLSFSLTGQDIYFAE